MIDGQGKKKKRSVVCLGGVGELWISVTYRDLQDKQFPIPQILISFFLDILCHFNFFFSSNSFFFLICGGFCHFNFLFAFWNHSMMHFGSFCMLIKIDTLLYLFVFCLFDLEALDFKCISQILPIWNSPHNRHSNFPWGLTRVGRSSAANGVQLV